jgi:hypothetical protein
VNEESKENNEMNDKKSAEIIEEVKEAGKDRQILFPRLEITAFSNKNIEEKKLITVTPNSINNQLKKIGDKFCFGRGDRNDYIFKDESIGPKQFEISYNSGNFYIVDNKKGTGLFIKIKDKIIVDHDMIVSFCASHMILQLDPNGN